MTTKYFLFQQQSHNIQKEKNLLRSDLWMIYLIFGFRQSSQQGRCIVKIVLKIVTIIAIILATLTCFQEHGHVFFSILWVQCNAFLIMYWKSSFEEFQGCMVEYIIIRLYEKVYFPHINYIKTNLSL